MRSARIAKEQQRLDSLFIKISEVQRASSNNIDLQNHWAKYLCVLVSGFLENSISAIFIDYAKKKATPQIMNFVEKKLEKFQNPNMEKIFQLVASFDETWDNQFKLRTEGEIKDAINSIVNSRNSIAHGKSVGVT